LLLGLLGLQKLLNDTLLLNQKGTNNTRNDRSGYSPGVNTKFSLSLLPLANAVSTSGTTVSTSDALVLSFNTRVGLGSQMRYLKKKKEAHINNPIHPKITLSILAFK